MNKDVNTVRLHKALSQSGVGSRREIEKWIAQGLIKINGKVADVGANINAADIICVNGKIVDNPLNIVSRTRVLLYHKPVGEISSRQDPKYTDTVFDNLPVLNYGRWVQVGRLDLNTSGLLIFTNNGELANRLMHPKYALEREYAVRVYGEVTPEILRILLKGVELDDGMARFKRINYRGGEGSNGWYNVVLTEGRNHEVRRLWQSQGLVVSRLVRVRYGNLRMPRTLSRGKYIELSPIEVNKLL